MVGIDKIREYFGNFNANYVIIGGTACNLNLEDADLQGRATKDVDIILVSEAISTEYVRQFWAFIKAGGYKPCKINSTDKTKRGYYRFIEPAETSFPAYIELFSRVSDKIWIPKDVHLAHIDTDEEYLTGFSVILMDSDYYNYAVKHSREIRGIQVLDKEALVILKIRAYLNNKKRKEEGYKIHQDDVDKHKKDIYRLSFLFSGEERYDVPNNIKTDFKNFLVELQSDPISTKAIAKAMGVAEVLMTEFVQKIEIMFQLKQV
jgi:hypothetical protein